MTLYTLPAISGPEGTITLKLNTSLGVVTIPTENTIVSVGPHKISLDFMAGEFQLQTFEIGFTEDYSTYSEGFWTKMLGDADLELQVIVDDDGTDNCTFWGVIEPQSTRLPELYTNDTTAVRRGYAVFRDDFVDKLRSVDVADILTEMDLHDIEGDTQLNMYAKVLDVFAAATMLAYDPLAANPNQTFAASQPTFAGGTAGGGIDLKFVASAVDYELSDLYFSFKYNTLIPPATNYAVHGYTDSGSADYWPTQFNNGWELIKALCVNFCVVPLHWYDATNDYHKLVLYQRGRAFADGLSFADAPSESTVVMGAHILHSAIAYNWRDTNIFYWQSDPVTYSSTATPPDSVDWELDARLQFLLDGSATQGWQKLYVAPSSADELVDSVKYWNYVTAAYSGDLSGEKGMQQVVVEYMLKRYSSWPTLGRSYPTVIGTAGAETSQNVVGILREVALYADDWSIVDCEKHYDGKGCRLTMVQL